MSCYQPILELKNSCQMRFLIFSSIIFLSHFICVGQTIDKSFLVEGSIGLSYFHTSKTEAYGRSNNFYNTIDIGYYKPMWKFSNIHSTSFIGAKIKMLHNPKYADSLETRYLDLQFLPFLRYSLFNFFVEIGGGVQLIVFEGKSKFESSSALFPNHKNRSELWYFEAGYSFCFIPDVYFEPSIQYMKKYSEQKIGNNDPINYTEKSLTFDIGMKYWIDKKPLSKFFNVPDFEGYYKQSTVVTSFNGLVRYSQDNMFEIYNKHYFDLYFNVGYFILDKNLFEFHVTYNNVKYGENEPEYEISPCIYYRNYFYRNFFGEGAVEITIRKDIEKYKNLNTGIGIGYSLPISKNMAIDFKSMFSRIEIIVKQFQPEIGNQINHDFSLNVNFLVFINN